MQSHQRLPAALVVHSRCRLPARIADTRTELFASCHKHEMPQQFREVPECLLDAVTRGLLRKFGGFANPELPHALSAIAIVQWTDIAQLESRNATTRRGTVLSAQSHTIDIELLSALWVLLLGRKRLPTMSQEEKMGKTSPDGKKPNGKMKVILLTGCKGAWRRGGALRAFFFRSVSLGTLGSLKSSRCCHPIHRGEGCMC